jgi:hypothetical protein
MIIAFVNFIKNYSSVKFVKPIFMIGSGILQIKKMKTIWTNEKFYKISDEMDLNVSNNKNIIVIGKETNSFNQINLLYSIAYMTILSHIGCFVPAQEFITDLYDTLISKINVV